MNFISTEAWEHLICATLHTLWQGAILAFALFAVLRAIPARCANLRYTTAIAALFGILFAGMVTWSVLDRHRPNIPVAISNAVLLNPVPVVAPPSLAVNQTAGTLSHVAIATPASQSPQIPWLDIIGILWICGAALMLLRTFIGSVRAGRLSTDGTVVTDVPTLSLVHDVATTLHIHRPIQVFMSESWRVPAVVGFIWPALLLPAELIGQMPPGQLRMIVAHEMAHIRRWDYLVNFLQQIVEALLFFNPAIWWISRQVRIEREACCDACAVRITHAPEEAARTLAAFAGLQVSGAMALTGQEGSLLDRIRRILRPHDRVKIRVPWYTTITAILVGGILLGLMRGGAELTVLAAEKILTPKERVEKIATLQKQIAPPMDEERKETVKYHGRLVTADGSPLPKRIWVNENSASGSRMRSSSIAVNQDGEFSGITPEGNLTLFVEVEGYAPVVSQTMPVTNDHPVPEITLMLERGFDSAVKLINSAGKPVADAEVRIGYQSHNDYNFFWGSTFRTDSEGRAIVHHACTRPARVTIDLPGYQFDLAKTILAENKETTITVKPAKPSTGLVVDETTGQPIQNATISLITRRGFDDQTYQPYSTYSLPPVLAKTDSAGRFSIDRLRDDSTYTFWVTAPGHGSKVLIAEYAGHQDMEIKLGQPRPITATILTDDPNDLPRELNVSATLTFSNSSWGYRFTIPVTSKDGHGEAIVPEPLPDVLKLEIKGKPVHAQAIATGRMTIDLRTNAVTPQPMRDVAIKLDWPKDGAEPTGKLRIGYSYGDNFRSYGGADYPIEHGVVRTRIPVPAKLHYTQGSMVGYWVEDRRSIEIPDGTEPYEMTAKLEPAGAIFGTLNQSDGNPYRDYFSISMVTVKKAPTINDDRHPDTLQPFSASGGSNQYLLSPIPIGGTYILLADNNKGSFALSRPITIDAKHTVQEIPLTFPEGVTVSGQIFYPDGTPASGTDVILYLNVNTPTTSHGSSGKVKTDQDGRFIMQHVNNTINGTYALRVAPSMKNRGYEIKTFKPDVASLKIQLEPGLTARGRLINAETGEPMINCRLDLRPRDWQKAAYNGDRIQLLTKQNGEFEAYGLEPIEYQIYIDDLYPAGSIVNRDANGKAISVTLGESPTITGGSTMLKEIKAIPSPWR